VPDSIVLTGGDAVVTLFPALGGKIASLRLAGREWLWTSDVLPYRVPDEAVRADDDVSYVKTADTGGYDECFPTVGPCTLPAGVAGTAHATGAAPLRLPDHGELWSQQPRTTVRREAGVEAATCEWTGRRLPYVFVREVAVHADGRVAMHYLATNTSDAPFPFLWSAHPLLPLGDRTRVRLPAGARTRVDATHGIALAAPPAEHRWPRVHGATGESDFSHPAALGDGWACKLFLDLPAAPVTATIEEDDARLVVAFDGAEVTHLGLWLNNHGWTPFDDGRPYRNLALEPCLGAPDSLSAALEAPWDAAPWLQPGESRRWTLTWRGERTSAGGGSR
jgi:galactose mutarotase-like enzyme